MISRNIFLNLNPLDHRYYLSNKEIFDKLSLYLSEDALIKYCIKCEIALLKSHIDLRFENTEDYKESLDKIEDKVTPEEVYKEEEITQHNIRALVNILKKKVPHEISHYVHLGATSVDILDTAASLRIKNAVEKVILPAIIEVEDFLTEIAEKEAETPQIGRTHGQFAVPITFGFAIAEYVSRLGKSIEKIHKNAQDLRGKLSGAVGGYNATFLITKNPQGLEERYLNYLSLKPSEHSTQLVEAEYMLRLLLEINIAFGILGNLADDLRNLQRSEISEIRESFKKDQVGSSTMPQKRNPWNSEHVKSMWKAFSPRVMTFFMDQISEHQRDLSNSASSRFITDYLAGFTAAALRMKKILSSLFIDREKMIGNIRKAGDMCLAEAAYIILAVEGESNAHEIIRKLTLECEQNNKSLYEVLINNPELWGMITESLGKITDIDPKIFFTNPENYRGITAEKAVQLSKKYRNSMSSIRKEIL